MAREYEKVIECKQCGELIGVFKEPGDEKGKWYDIESDILHTKTCKNPIQFKRRSTYPEKERRTDAVTEEILDIKKRIGNLEEAVKALVKQVDNFGKLGQ